MTQENMPRTEWDWEYHFAIPSFFAGNALFKSVCLLGIHYITTHLYTAYFSRLGQRLAQTTMRMRNSIQQVFLCDAEAASCTNDVSPAPDAQNSQVKAEVTYQAQRIGHHASLAIWGGNNEVETAFTWFPEPRTNPNLFAVDFNVLFVETVREAILSVDSSVAFVDTSPSNGVYSLNPYVKRFVHPFLYNPGTHITCPLAHIKHF